MLQQMYTFYRSVIFFPKFNSMSAILSYFPWSYNLYFSADFLPLQCYSLICRSVLFCINKFYGPSCIHVIVVPFIWMKSHGKENILLLYHCNLSSILQRHQIRKTLWSVIWNDKFLQSITNFFALNIELDLYSARYTEKKLAFSIVFWTSELRRFKYFKVCITRLKKEQRNSVECLH